MGNEKNGGTHDTTRASLEAYRKMGSNEALETWRREVPGDVRRIWIRHMMTEVMDNKLAGDEALRSAADQDESPDEQEKFARLYFLSFWDNKRAVKKFEERRDRLVQAGGAAVGQLLREPDRVTALARDAQGLSMDTDELNHSVESWKKNMRAYSRRGGTPIESIIVTGSAAIGPRTPDYPIHQDLDLLFIPSMHGRNDNKKESLSSSTRWGTESMQGIFTYIQRIASTVEQLTKAGAEDELVTLYASLKKNTPVLGRLLEQHKNQTRLLFVDLHLPHDPLNLEGVAEDWTKLAGPHRVYRQDTGSHDRAYKWYMERAISSARQSSSAKTE